MKRQPWSAFRGLWIMGLVCAFWAATLSAQGQEDPMKGLNQKAPALSLTKYVQGNEVKIGDGKNYVVVEFWATWCPPCRQSIPHLTELYKKYKDRGVAFVGISDEEEGDVAPFVKQMGEQMAYPVALDKDSETTKAYLELVGSEGIPTAVVLDPKGVVVWKGHPMNPLFERFLEAKAAAGKPAPPATSSTPASTAK